MHQPEDFSQPSSGLGFSFQSTQQELCPLLVGTFCEAQSFPRSSSPCKGVFVCFFDFLGSPLFSTSQAKQIVSCWGPVRIPSPPEEARVALGGSPFCFFFLFWGPLCFLLGSEQFRVRSPKELAPIPWRRFLSEDQNGGSWWPQCRPEALPEDWGGVVPAAGVTGARTFVRALRGWLFFLFFCGFFTDGWSKTHQIPLRTRWKPGLEQNFNIPPLKTRRKRGQPLETCQVLCFAQMA